MPTRLEIEEAITRHKATLDKARADGADGPIVWAIESRIDRLLEQLREAD